MKPKLLLAIVLLGLCSLVVWMKLRSSDDSSAPRAGFTNREVVSSLEAEAKSPVLETPPLPTGQSETPGKAAEGERAAATMEKVDYAAKYAGWSLDRLEGAKAILDKSNFEKVQEVLAERYKAGLFEELIVKEGEGTPPMSGPHRIDSGGEPPGPGLVRYKITKLPLEEYPLLTAENDELSWLWSRTYELSKPPKK